MYGLAENSIQFSKQHSGVTGFAFFITRSKSSWLTVNMRQFVGGNFCCKTCDHSVRSSHLIVDEVRNGPDPLRCDGVTLGEYL